MKAIKFSSNYGQFAYSISATIGEDVNAATEQLCLQGLANLGYRVGGSGVDKALEASGAKGAKDARSAVEYSEASRVVVQKAMDTKLAEMSAKEAGKYMADLGVKFAVEGEYVPAETAGGKEATEKWALIQQYPAERFAAALQKLGLGEDYTDAQGIAAVGKLIREAKAAAAKAAMAGLEGV